MSELPVLDFCFQQIQPGIIRVSFSEPIVPSGLKGALDASGQDFVLSQDKLPPDDAQHCAFVRTLADALKVDHQELQLIGLRRSSAYELVVRYSPTLSDIEGLLVGCIGYCSDQHGRQIREVVAR